ncbi:MAG: hypothetical protein ACRYFS_16755 [Janthinobacterium lividum]
MSQVHMMVPPPDNWQDFERLTFLVCEAIWPNDDVKQHGRPGQAQQGVDIYRCVTHKQEWVGVQCKRRNPTDALGSQEVGGQLTLSEVEAEVRAATSFTPSLNQFIIATTAFTDSKLQAKIRTLASARSLTGQFSVSVWFWENIQSYLNQHMHVMYCYYSEFMQLNSVYNADKHIL